MEGSIFKTMTTENYIYDLESYPNIFTFCGKFEDSNEIHLFEISDRMNQIQELLNWLSYLRNAQPDMVGFNNIGYDYYLIHELITNPYTFGYDKAFQLGNRIIKSQGKAAPRIRPNERYIPQVDLYRINHFDNRAKSTSLKALQFNMRTDSLEDLPFDIRALNDQEKNELREYNVHDVTETEKFLKYNKHHIAVRKEYLRDGMIFGDVVNFSDVKIGTKYFETRLGRARTHSGSKPRQTMRHIIQFDRTILPKIYYRTERYQYVLNWFKQQTVYIETKERPKLEVDLAGLHFHFGVGGVHASAENKKFYSDETYQIIDIDVTGMYPAVAIANRFAPEHLGETFVDVYKQVKSDRAKYPKGTPRNKALKLAMNGVYGNSNNLYSCFYDPQYMFNITINGQLQILQLVEMIELLPDCELIQANTDGITVRINKKYEYWFKLWCDEWEKMTGLELERVDYNRMWIRDVNNYMAETMKGKLKRKGAYAYPVTIEDYDGWWNKDYSNLASKIAAEKCMTDGWPVEVAIKLVTNPFDFMLRYKATGSSKLYIGDKPQLKTVRYYVSTEGEPMKKVAPPKGEIGQYKRKNKITDEYFDKVMKEIGKDEWDERIHNKKKTKYETVETSVQSGWKVKQCNKASDFNWNDVNWQYYIQETKKLIIGEKI